MNSRSFINPRYLDFPALIFCSRFLCITPLMMNTFNLTNPVEPSLFHILLLLLILLHGSTKHLTFIFIINYYIIKIKYKYLFIYLFV
jgi:hypothetical protein